MQSRGSRRVTVLRRMSLFSIVDHPALTKTNSHSISLVTSEPADGGFQHYTKVPAAKAAILPQNISFNSGSVLPLAFDTAVVGLSVKGNLELPMPSLKPKSSGKTIVVWGGSSSVGALATQLAVVGGVKVIATASSHNFDFCKTCGATEVFDYKSSSVVDDLVKAVESAGGEFAGVYDTISLPASYEHTVPVIEKLGGGKLVCVLPGPKDAPSNVQTCQVFGVNDDTHQLWEHYITPALENGSLKCMPEPLVIGTGLEAIQQGFDKNKAGVSAKEVVIELKH